MSEAQVWPSNRIVTLTCGCIAVFLVEPPPEVGDDLQCSRRASHGMQWVTEVDTEYRVKCLSCSVSKPFGVALLQAQLFADGHHRRKPLHKIQLRKGATVVEVRVPSAVMETLPFDAPF